MDDISEQWIERAQYDLDIAEAMLQGTHPIQRIYTMAQIDITVEQRARAAVASLSRFAPVTAAYLFGSQVEGKTDQWSDIDLAVFVEGLEAWDLRDRARIAAQVQREAGDDVELHFFTAESLQHHQSASFAAWVLNHGVKLAS